MSFLVIYGNKTKKEKSSDIIFMCDFNDICYLLILVIKDASVRNQWTWTHLSVCMCVYSLLIRNP